jgi:predicted transcriptional regulator
MHINSKELLFGQPILKIREVIRFVMEEKCFGDSKAEIIKKVAIVLNLPNTTTKQVIEQLITEDYLILNKEKSGNKYQYELAETSKGRRFGIASAAPVISRQKATQLLNDLIKRAEVINANKDLVYFVERIKVFGSYLSDKGTLGDLDVGFKLSSKNNGIDFTSLNQKRIFQAKTNGKIFKSFIDELYWPYREIELMLKNKQRSLSLHNEEKDGVLNLAESRLVYQYEENQSE